MGTGCSAREPASGTVERWAWDLIHTKRLVEKLTPAAPPSAWEPDPPARRLASGSQGRPPELTVVARSPKTPRPGALHDAAARARLIHTFLHHELQAAELMAWALLAFPETPRAFRAGLVGIARDELRHVELYRGHLVRLGYEVGAFGVRDWFWERVPTCATPVAFVALLGLGFEGGNLEHARTFAERFRAVGDEEGARVQERVGMEEVRHVRFAARWFRRWTGGLEFERWVAELPRPLTPQVCRGAELNRPARLAAGLGEAFLQELEAWSPASGS